MYEQVARVLPLGTKKTKGPLGLPFPRRILSEKIRRSGGLRMETRGILVGGEGGGDFTGFPSED